MPLDPQIQAVLTAVKVAGLPEPWQVTPDEARVQYQARVKRVDVKDEPIHRVSDRLIPGPDRPIPLRVYRPRDTAMGERLGVFLWFHGGGFVIGNLDTHDSACRRLAKEADVVVVAVDYRLAPEHKFPAAVDDCMAALRWVAMHGGPELDVDTSRIAVGGDSAGGNLAAVCSLLARNEGAPKISHQLLIYPGTAPEPETASHRKFAEGYLLSRNSITWFYKQYLRTSRDAEDFRFAPLLADDLSGLPPAFVLVAGYDPLRDEGVQYAARLMEAGNECTLWQLAGMVHGFILMLGAVDAASDALRVAGAEVRKALAKR
ncbi:MAG: alpha/beta hydrolase [Betaproteobacteria bacterium]|nr:alpha/beta hydrolase [Betaproteobacteria bacterium]